FLGRHRRSLRLAQDLAFENPDLNANNSVCCTCFGRCVVDIGTQGVQRHTAFAIPFSTCNFSTAESATNLNFDTFRPLAHGILHCTLHGATEHYPALQLLSDTVCHQL